MKKNHKNNLYYHKNNIQRAKIYREKIFTKEMTEKRRLLLYSLIKGM